MDNNQHLIAAQDIDRRMTAGEPVTEQEQEWLQEYIKSVVADNTQVIDSRETSEYNVSTVVTFYGITTPEQKQRMVNDIKATLPQKKLQWLNNKTV